MTELSATFYRRPRDRAIASRGGLRYRRRVPTFGFVTNFEFGASTSGADLTFAPTCRDSPMRPLGAAERFPIVTRLRQMMNVRRQLVGAFGEACLARIRPVRVGAKMRDQQVEEAPDLSRQMMAMGIDGADWILGLHERHQHRHQPA